MGQKSIVIVADLGELKAFRIVEKEGINRQADLHAKAGAINVHAVLEEIAAQEYIEAHRRKIDLVSDKEGNFKGGTGEAHQADTEKKKRQIKEIAEDIAAIVHHEKPASWHLAFPKENCAKLKEALSSDVKDSMAKCVDANLVKTDKNKILSFFK